MSRNSRRTAPAGDRPAPPDGQAEDEAGVPAALRRVDQQLTGHAQMKGEEQIAVQHDDEELAQPVHPLDATARQQGEHVLRACNPGA